MTTGGPPAAFPDLLRAALDDKGVSVRELSRRISADGEKPEKERRMLYRYLAGENVPERERVDRIEAALGLTPGTLPSANDAQRPARAHDLLMEIREQTATLTSLLEQPNGTASADLVSRHLQALEAVVAAQGQATTAALQALARDIRRLERRLAPPDPPATQTTAQPEP